MPKNLLCHKESGMYNPMMNLLIDPSEEILKMLYQRSTGMFPIYTLIIYFFVYFFLVFMSAGMFVAGGLFVPMMLLGGTIGLTLGQIIDYMLPNIEPNIDPSIYALVGSAAMITGFSRLTISIAVIMVELTQATEFLLPITFSILFSKWIADIVSGPYYDELLEVKNIPYLEQKPPHRTVMNTVTDIMTTDVDCLHTVETVGNIINLLTSTHHNGYPVIDTGPSGDRRTFRGIILRKELIFLIDQKVFQENKDPLPLTVEYKKYKDFMGTKPPLLERILPTESETHKFVDLRPFLNQSAINLSESFSFMEAYKLFRLLELRHLTVTNDRNEVVGLITRQDLLFFHFEESERHNDFIINEDNL